MINHLALLITADDLSSAWEAGLMCIEEHSLNPGRSRDAEGTFSRTGKQRIRRLWAGHGQLAENLLPHLQEEVGKRSSKPRLRGATGTAKPAQTSCSGRFSGASCRNDVAAVAQQDDVMMRARGNGGARAALQPEGIGVFGHQENCPAEAAALGLSTHGRANSCRPE